jgi:hypothetical protein
MEKTICFEKALACPHKKDLSQVRASFCKKTFGKNKQEKFFLQQLPGVVLKSFLAFSLLFL